MYKILKNLILRSKQMKNYLFIYGLLGWIVCACSVLDKSYSEDQNELFFIDISEQSGIMSIYNRSRFDEYPYGSGVVVLDYDKDGKDDVFYSDRTGLDLLYRNQGDGTFIDVAAGASITGGSQIGNGGGCSADYDNDGDQDLYVSSHGYSRLYNNDGMGSFVDVSLISGVQESGNIYSTGCAWGDYDEDGFLDFVVTRHLHGWDITKMEDDDFVKEIKSLVLFQNNQDGTFTDVSYLLSDNEQSQNQIDKEIGGIFGAGFQPVWVDFDNDRDLDLYVVNDFGELISPNVLWENKGLGLGNKWHFEDISFNSGADIAIYGMGVSVGDYDGDGFFDLFMTNIGDNVLLKNSGNGINFIDVTDIAGVGLGSLGDESRVTWGTVFFDYDNDGDEDLYVISGYLDHLKGAQNPKSQNNLLLSNNNDGTFKNVSLESGLDNSAIGRGTAFIDFNNDGCLDIFVANIGDMPKLYQNRCNWGNHWLQVHLIGTTVNKDAIGSRIKLISNGQTQIREVSAGGSFIGQNMMTAHFGLGSTQIIDSLVVFWSDGTEQQVEDLKVDTKIIVKQINPN